MTERAAARRLVLGTRGSALALWQARWIARALREAHAGLEIEERIVRTGGDLQQDAPFGGSDVGFFVREIESALVAGTIDLAVHSLKDLPTDLPAGLTLAAVPPRHDPRDALLSPRGFTLDELPAGARVATGSPRRRTQLLHARPDLRIVGVRGNVDTRIAKLVRGEFDALVLAVAGVERLGLDQVPYRPLDPAVCLPAVGQAALAVEVRADDRAALEWTACLDDRATRDAVEAERAFLRRLGGGCLAPATAYARGEGGGLRLEALVGDLDGQRILRDRLDGPCAERVALGERLAERMLADGAGALLRQARGAG